MSLTYEQAVEALTGRNLTVESLFALVESVSGAVPEATKDTTYLLNSGPMPDGSETSAVIREIQRAGGGVSVGQSEVGRFLNSAREA
jgi:hypothetical protein